jgi:hypothetical protein
MSDHLAMALFVVLGLALAAFMHLRGRSKATPVLEPTSTSRTAAAPRC